ncbi:piezo-type mechanosensitive ion channel homolog [Prunus yedoensis var. nudiflora]|uniref:Piezo-type mechanosensitive ion channel homolog n=1 Tax=Prunus yedoensis var. nudiflora TaxID=2094558 RepID=A0A314UCF8_PRUYE|nr:piezo-type mechanosensitive ion channel homolog [Prunus yedoensis var. nudiflora]
MRIEEDERSRGWKTEKGRDFFHDINSSDVDGCGGLRGPMAIIVSEETPRQGIIGDTLSKFSIWGLYMTFVLAVGRFIRLQCSDLRMSLELKRSFIGRWRRFTGHHTCCSNTQNPTRHATST